MVVYIHKELADKYKILLSVDSRKNKEHRLNKAWSMRKWPVRPMPKWFPSVPCHLLVMTNFWTSTGALTMQCVSKRAKIINKIWSVVGTPTIYKYSTCVNTEHIHMWKLLFFGTLLCVVFNLCWWTTSSYHYNNIIIIIHIYEMFFE